ncbi:MAG: phospholipase [Betaproteobacteria bacterium HGW-Betaproteobacteria-6]|jgi:phospholipase A1|nr:MAG: phospholipase [Betaproteobacteria bacterium HGW-Betaproteobacteria-6]
MKPPVFALLLCASLPLAANGQSLEDCRRVATPADRLACYDALTPAETPAPQATAAATSPEAAASADLKEPEADSLLGAAWELDPDKRGRILRIRPYKPVYILPGFHTSHTNPFPASPSVGHTSTTDTGQASDEAKLQISLKTKLAEDLFGDNGDLWFGYTQSSRWQVYSASTSRPFRETNHEPEVMLVWRTDYTLGGWRGRYLSLGVNHQSNGRSLPLSRSWNRVIAGIALERGDWTLTLRPWWRIPEAGEHDDNPDISNYLGRADLQIVRIWGKHQLSLLLRHSLQGGGNSHGALQLDYAFPLSGSLRGHLQWFSGYGESMIDYNHRANYYGVGVSLLEWY